VRGLWSRDQTRMTPLQVISHLVPNDGSGSGSGGSMIPGMKDIVPSGLIAYYRALVPKVRSDGLRMFNVRHAMSLALGENEQSIEEGNEEGNKGNEQEGNGKEKDKDKISRFSMLFGETKNAPDHGKIFLKQLSSSNMVADMLTHHDRTFMEYVGQTLGPYVILKPGVSHYAWGAYSQVITLIWVFIFFGKMTHPADGGLGTDQITDALKNGGGFDGKMVLLLLVHIIIMILDRIAHRYRWLSLKIWIHIGLCIFFHFWIFLYLQNSTTNVTVYKNSTLLFYYILQLIFLITSSRQIKNGYPVFVAADERDKQYSSRNGMIFKTWRGVPFLYEMNSIFNWICADTSLGELMCVCGFIFDDLFLFVFTLYKIYFIYPCQILT